MAPDILGVGEREADEGSKTRSERTVKRQIEFQAISGFDVVRMGSICEICI